VTAVNQVRPGYFEAMGIAVLEGRDLTAVDETDASDVAVVSRSLARKMWPGEDAVGQTLLEGNDPTHPRTLTVVGVVSDARANDLDQGEVTDQIYLPIDPSAARRYFLLARTGGAPPALVPALRKALLGAEPDVPVTLRPMTDVLREDQLQWSMSSAFLGGFGLGAILLATLGIYGLIAYSVGQRRKEMGVRLALGASRAEIRRRVMGHGVRLAAIGVVIGLAGSLALGRVVASLLYGVSPFDPLTLGAVLTLFLTVAALASLLPAERASRTDPVAALRSE
jgi:predicted permease